MLKEVIKHAPQKQIKDVLGTAFVLACKNNNILLAKFLLEQGVDEEERKTLRAQGVEAIFLQDL